MVVFRRSEAMRDFEQACESSPTMQEAAKEYLAALEHLAAGDDTRAAKCLAAAVLVDEKGVPLEFDPATCNHAPDTLRMKVSSSLCKAIHLLRSIFERACLAAVLTRSCH